MDWVGGAIFALIATAALPAVLIGARRWQRGDDRVRSCWRRGAAPAKLTAVSAFGLVLDCAEPETLAEFWAAALGYEPLGTVGNYVALVPPTSSPRPHGSGSSVPPDWAPRPGRSTAAPGSSWPTPRATSSAFATPARP